MSIRRILYIKQQLEKVAQLEVAQAAYMLREEVETLAIMNYNRQKTEEMFNIIGSYINADRFNLERNYLEELNMLANRKKEEVVKAEEVRAVKVDNWKRSKLEMEKYNVVIDKFNMQKREEEKKVEEKEMNDIGMILFTGAKR